MVILPSREELPNRLKRTLGLDHLVSGWCEQPPPRCSFACHLVGKWLVIHGSAAQGPRAKSCKYSCNPNT